MEKEKRERKIVVDVTYLTQFCHLMLMKHTNQPAYIGTLRAGKGKGDLRARGANQVGRVLFSRSASTASRIVRLPLFFFCLPLDTTHTYSKTSHYLIIIVAIIVIIIITH